MCRLAGYLGPDISLEQFLLEPAHSLYVQSWDPQELRYAKLNADGFGFGWYTDDGTPAVYTNPMPIWSDPNLPHLGRTLRRNLWLANVRSATGGHGVNHTNTQPFFDDELLFLHNGFLTEFPRRLRPAIRDAVDLEIEADVRGNTDSEYIFALLRHLLRADEDMPVEEAIVEAFALLAEWSEGLPALLNVVVADGERLYAARHALDHDCPSLYYTTDDEAFPNGQVVASEPLTESDFWQPVPEHHMLILDPEEPPEMVEL